jgi:hypothetical protein
MPLNRVMADDDLVEVVLPSGGKFQVYRREQSHFKERVKRYTADNHFTSVSDLQELDRIMTLELMVWRWGNWLSQQKDYWGQPVDERDMNRTVKEMSVELRQIKAALGIDKVTRDKTKGEGSVSVYLENLKLRAKEFGVVRERQLAKSLELFNDLKAKIVLYDNCTEDERRELGCDEEGVISWIRDVAIPDYDVIDAHFRASQQRFWIRDQ